MIRRQRNELDQRLAHVRVDNDRLSKAFPAVNEAVTNGGHAFQLRSLVQFIEQATQSRVAISGLRVLDLVSSDLPGVPVRLVQRVLESRGSDVQNKNQPPFQRQLRTSAMSSPVSRMHAEC